MLRKLWAFVCWLRGTPPIHAEAPTAPPTEAAAECHATPSDPDKLGAAEAKRLAEELWDQSFNTREAAIAHLRATDPALGRLVVTALNELTRLAWDRSSSTNKYYANRPDEPFDHGIIGGPGPSYAREDITVSVHRLTPEELAEFCRTHPIADNPQALSSEPAVVRDDPLLRACYRACLADIHDADRARLYARGGVAAVRDMALRLARHMLQRGQTVEDFARDVAGQEGKDAPVV